MMESTGRLAGRTQVMPFALIEEVLPHLDRTREAVGVDVPVLVVGEEPRQGAGQGLLRVRAELDDLFDEAQRVLAASGGPVDCDGWPVRERFAVPIDARSLHVVAAPTPAR